MADSSLSFPRKSTHGWYSRGYFPHFDGYQVTQHLMFGLFDCLPKRVLTRFRHELATLPLREAEIEMRIRIEQYIDRGAGACFMREARIADVVQEAILFFDQQRYRMHAWCVMPNHVHALITPIERNKIHDITQSWKSFTAKECNRILARTGPFWQRESFDRYIRNARHYRNALRYIEHNPVNAGLCEKPEDWAWSSARLRVQS